jgi:Asp-tRNA(Asn)/Glu-tRNA(Gln) amidotransferase A subunit family amidase
MTPTAAAEIAALPALLQRELIGRRQLSPVELLQAHQAQIAAFDPAVNAICATDPDAALASARAAEAAVMRGDALPLLHGLPVGVKDLEETAGLLTTYGNTAFRDHVPSRDCVLVQRLRAAGAVIAAKTNTPDMGAGANTRNAVWGATGNPFDPTRNAGGSSGGSAVALALDMLPLCTGSDLGGSLRIPAALCGIVGYRPSPGVVASDNRPLAFNPLPVLGPMARSVGDLALMLAAIAGAHPADPLSGPFDTRPLQPLAPADLSRLRVGFTEDFGCCLVDEDIRATFRARIAAIAPLFAACEPVGLDVGDADGAFDVLRAEGFLAAHADTLRRAPESLGPNVRANLELASRFTLADRAQAHATQSRLQRAFARAGERFDLILAPVTPVSPFPWTTLYAEAVQGQPTRNYYHWLALTYVVTLATHPALSLPCDADAQGFPFGLQLIGRARGDVALLQAALALEAATAGQPGLGRVRPDRSRLQQPQPALRAIATHPPAGR